MNHLHTIQLCIRHGLLPTTCLPDQALSSGGREDTHPGFATGDLLTSGEQIHSVIAAATADPSLILDATDCYVLPGFIDVHVHGGAGYDTMDATTEALEGMARFFAQHGVTAFLPTTMTAPHAAILQAVATVGQWQAQPVTGTRSLGLHIEGPYISPQFPGAQPAIYIRPPNLHELDELLAAGPVRMITLAPEVAGAAEFITTARRQGVISVWGHTDATYEVCVRAAEWGVTQATHTYNAMRAFNHRVPATVGATLALDGIYAQLIADNIHVHPAAIKILARCKGIERTILITDAMRAAGLPAGDYDLGGQTVTVKEGMCQLADGTLAGSILTMERALANFIAATGLSLAEAWPVTSRTPAQSLGLAQQMGSIAPGYRADLVLLDAQLEVVATIVGSQIVYLREPARLQRK